MSEPRKLRLLVEIDVELLDPTWDEKTLRDNFPDFIESAMEDTLRQDHADGSPRLYTIVGTTTFYVSDYLDAFKEGGEGWAHEDRTLQESINGFVYRQTKWVPEIVRYPQEKTE